MPDGVVRSLFATLALAILSLAAAGPAGAVPLEAMAGQMIVVGFQGDTVDAAAVRQLRALLAESKLGGVMYLKTNVASLPDVLAMNDAFLKATPDLAPFITLDQEGGAVERLTGAVGFAEIANARAIAANNSVAGAVAIYQKMAHAIAQLGFTVNFGPVADVDVNPANQIIAKFGRAFSADPAVVAAYDQAFITAHVQEGLIPVLKHFPGHGSSTADSHEGFVDISKTWSPMELDPYRTLFADGFAGMVMVGHLYHKDYAAAGSQTPASLSPQWVTGVLRGDLGFKGVVISDDLEMGAIRKHFSLRQTVIAAVDAGIDVLLFSNTAAYNPGLSEKIRAILVAEGKASPAFAQRITQSYQRIMALKAKIH